MALKPTARSQSGNLACSWACISMDGRPTSIKRALFSWLSYNHKLGIANTPCFAFNLATSVGRGGVCGYGCAGISAMRVKAGELAPRAARRLERLQAVLAGRGE